MESWTNLRFEIWYKFLYIWSKWLIIISWFRILVVMLPTLPTNFCLPEALSWAKVVSLIFCGVEGSSILVSKCSKFVTLKKNLIIEKLQANSYSFTEFISDRKQRCVCVCVYVKREMWNQGLLRCKSLFSPWTVSEKWIKKSVYKVWSIFKKFECKTFYLLQGTTLFLMAQGWRTCLPMQETWVWSLGWKDPLEKEMVAHSSSLAWEIPWTEEPGGL